MDYKQKVITLLDSQELSEEQKRKLKEIFPELHESEDEKVRKAIVKMMKVPRKEIFEAEGITKEQALAYLEKQKEQKPAEGDNETEIQKAFREGKSAGRKEVFDHPEEYGLQEEQQEPAEWSEEDKEMLDAMIDIVSHSLYEPLCPREGMLAWLKSLRPQPHWKPSAEQMEWLKSAACLSTDKPTIHETIVSLYESLKRL